MAFEIKYIVYIENIPLVKGYRENVTVFSRKCNFFRRFEQNYQNLCKKKKIQVCYCSDNKAVSRYLRFWAAHLICHFFTPSFGFVSPRYNTLSPIINIIFRFLFILFISTAKNPPVSTISLIFNSPLFTAPFRSCHLIPPLPPPISPSLSIALLIQ